MAKRIKRRKKDENNKNAFKEACPGVQATRSGTWETSWEDCEAHKKKLEQKKVFAFEKSSTPRGLVWNTNMAAVSLFWNTNMAAVTSQLKPKG